MSERVFQFIIVVMVLGTALGIFLGQSTTDAARSRYCRTRLATATTAADTMRVYDDTTSRYRCEFYP